jgi:hypothetical protein
MGHGLFLIPIKRLILILEKTPNLVVSGNRAKFVTLEVIIVAMNPFKFIEFYENNL